MLYIFTGVPISNKKLKFKIDFKNNLISFMEPSLTNRLISILKGLLIIIINDFLL